MKRLKPFNLPIKIAISASILVVLAMRMDTNVAADLMTHFKASSWAYATIFMLFQLLLLSLRWKILLNVGRKTLTLVDTIQINLTSQLANLVFVTSIGGMVAKIALSVQHGASLLKTLIATVLDRILTLSALLLLSAFFIPSLGEYVDSTTFKTLSSYVSIFVVTMFVFAPLFLSFVVFRLPHLSKTTRRVRYGIRYIKVLLNAPLLCGKLLLLSLLAQTSFFVAVFFLAQSTGISLGFFQLMIVLPMISLISALPVSIGGWGVREGAFVYGLGLLGVPMETAFLLSIQVGLISMIATIMGGIPSLITSDIELGRLSAIRERLTVLKS